MTQRPIGFNGKPIHHGMLYSDYTPEQIEAACNAHDFEEKCAHAQENMDKMGELMRLQLDKDIKGLEMKQRSEGLSSPYEYTVRRVVHLSEIGELTDDQINILRSIPKKKDLLAFHISTEHDTDIPQTVNGVDEALPPDPEVEKPTICPRCGMTKYEGSRTYHLPSCGRGA